MAEKTFYRDTLLPKPDETAQAFYDRMAATNGSDSKDRAMIEASKAVAVAWKGLDGMENPFKAEAMDDPGTPRENLETAVILMADAIKAQVSKLDQLRDPKEEIKSAISKHGSHLPPAARKAVEATVKNQVVASHDRAVKDIVNGVKGPFDALIEMAEDMPEASPEAAVMADMEAAYGDFKAARGNLMGYGKDQKKTKKRRR